MAHWLRVGVSCVRSETCPCSSSVAALPQLAIWVVPLMSFIAILAQTQEFALACSRCCGAVLALQNAQGQAVLIHWDAPFIHQAQGTHACQNSMVDSGSPFTLEVPSQGW